MSPVPVRSAFSHTLVAGMAVGATMTAAGITAPPVAAADLTVTPAQTTQGTSPEYSLSWNRISGGGTQLKVTLSGFTPNAGADCSSSTGTVRLTIGTTPATYACQFDASTSRFILTRTDVSAYFPAGQVDLTFPAGMILAPNPGTGTFAVDLLELQATASVDIAPATASPAPPDWMRQYQRGSADEQCLPQWNPSYAMWANAGAGGWICVQTDHWDTSLGRWTLL